MVYKTHQITALSVTSILLSFGLEPGQLEYFKPALTQLEQLSQTYRFLNQTTFPLIILLIVSFGALIPDLDHKDSYISKKLIIISFFSSMFLSHRGPTHRLDYNILFFGILAIITMEYFNQPLLSYLIVWLGIGSILHIYGDMHTKSGVKLFGSKKKKLGFHINKRFFGINYGGTAFYVLPKFLRFRTKGWSKFNKNTNSHIRPSFYGENIAFSFYSIIFFGTILIQYKIINLPNINIF